MDLKFLHIAVYLQLYRLRVMSKIRIYATRKHDKKICKRKNNLVIALSTCCSSTSQVPKYLNLKITVDIVNLVFCAPRTNQKVKFYIHNFPYSNL